MFILFMAPQKWHTFLSFNSHEPLITNPYLAARGWEDGRIAGWPYAHIKILRRKFVLVLVQA